MTLDFIWHFFCFFPSTFGFKIQGLRLQKKRHKDLLSILHIVSLLRSFWNMSENISNLVWMQFKEVIIFVTDRLTDAVHTHQHYIQIILLATLPRFPLCGRRPPSPASGLCSPAANWPNQFFRPWGQVEKNLKYPSPFHLSASHLIIVILSPKQSNKMLESGGRMG